MAGRDGASTTSGRALLRSESDVVRQVGLVALVGVVYYLGARLGLNLSLVADNVTPLWPPTGIAVAAFLLLGRSMWPGVAVAALAVNLPISEGPIAAVVTAAGNTIAPLVAVILLQSVDFRRQLDRHRDALAIVILGALVSMLISATIGTLTLWLSGAIPSSQVASAWAVWWTGDALGVLAFTPFLLCLPLFRELPAWPRARWIEAIAIFAVVAVVSVWATYSDLQIMVLTIPVLGWASWRLQLRGAAPAALIATLVATWSAAHGMGPFEHGSLFDTMVSLQAFNACVALTSFFLAALVSERMQAARALAVAAVELEEKVQHRTAELSDANLRLMSEIRERSEAQEQLSQEEARARREHQIAEMLQRGLLPDQLPEIPGVSLAAHYVPAAADMQVGGDWYDVVHLSGGMIALAIGDVAGHGPQAAATMGQVRMALRAYALQDPSPVSVMNGVHRLVAQLSTPEMVTLMYALLDPATRSLRFCNAGHPPAVVLADEECRYLEGGLAPPMGVTPDATFTEASVELPRGATTLLYTDGLVERRGVSLQDGLDRLSRELRDNAGREVDDLCDRLLTSMLGQEQRVADDVALLALQLVPLAGRPLRMALPAEPRMLVKMRAALRQWLRESEVADAGVDEILVACGEACANVVQHAYNGTAGVMELEATLADDVVELIVRDHGSWRPAADRGGGWGLQLIGGLMDAIDVDPSTGGTAVRMRRRVEVG